VLKTFDKTIQGKKENIMKKKHIIQVFYPDGSKVTDYSYDGTDFDYFATIKKIFERMNGEDFYTTIAVIEEI
jgi:hypothetical protein